MNDTTNGKGVAALDLDEHTHIMLHTVVGRDLLLECDPAEIDRFWREASTSENIANGGAGLEITTKGGDVVKLLAGADAVQRVTRRTVLEAEEKARQERERQEAREHVLLSGKKTGLISTIRR